jgi:thiosulfate dehydrogenase (quinone) large subunit
MPACAPGRSDGIECGGQRPEELIRRHPAPAWLICINARRPRRMKNIVCRQNAARTPIVGNRHRWDTTMNTTTLQRSLIVYFRLAIGWTFLYAGAWQVMDPHWSVATFLAHTKTFHDAFAVFAAPGIEPYTTFAVKWGHLLIGLSLVSGLLVRISGVFGIMLMLTYYFAHMDFPFIESHVNFIMDFHLVYAGVLVYLMSVNAGTVFGLDGVVERLHLFGRHPHMGAMAR